MISDETYEARRTFFNERAETWLDTWYKDPAKGTYTRHHEKFKRLFALVPIQEGDHVLDVGCGSGILVPHLLEKVSARGVVYELDYAEKMIRVNYRLHQDRRVKFIIADAADMPLEKETCDVVICFACFPHIPDKKAALEAMTAVLKRNGYLAVAHLESSQAINDHHRKSGTPVMHDKLPKRQEMISLFEENDLSIEHFIDESGFYLVLGRKGWGLR
jgi:ubiquinone/menaquinone biosynthesis C-methylase UbiE